MLVGADLRGTGWGWSLLAEFRVTATSSSSEVNGSCTAMTLNPSFCRIGMSLLNDDPSAHAPCTSTTFVFDCMFIYLLTFVSVCCANAGKVKSASPAIAVADAARLTRLREIRVAFLVCSFLSSAFFSAVRVKIRMPG